MIRDENYRYVKSKGLLFGAVLDSAIAQLRAKDEERETAEAVRAWVKQAGRASLPIPPVPPPEGGP